MNTEIPRLKLFSCLSLPLIWVVENLDTGELSQFHCRLGYEKRTPYRGHRQALYPVWGYCFFGTGVPLRRPWPEVCTDRTGVN